MIVMSRPLMVANLSLKAVKVKSNHELPLTIKLIFDLI